MHNVHADAPGESGGNGDRVRKRGVDRDEARMIRVYENHDPSRQPRAMGHELGCIQLRGPSGPMAPAVAE